jgi:Family of unknown function (DUF5681)
MRNDDDSYLTGFRKPPKHTQFRKGVSGNPNGRPKGSKNLASIFRKISEEKVQVNGPKGLRYISKLEAGITQLANRAAKGDLKAIRELIYWKRTFGDVAPTLAPPIFNINFCDPEDYKPEIESQDEKH